MFDCALLVIGVVAGPVNHQDSSSLESGKTVLKSGNPPLKETPLKSDMIDPWSNIELPTLEWSNVKATLPHRVTETSFADLN